MLNFNNVNWKDIEGYNDNYTVSENGDIYSKKRNIIMKSALGQLYLLVSLRHEGRSFTKTVHRLVAEHFIPNPLNKPEVNHIDGNKLNNNVCNLEWVTSSENSLHAIKTGLQKPTKPHLGKKLGVTSKYRNVMRDRKTWRARVKNDGKILTNKNFKTEEDAARHVNETIDLHKLNRPRNVIK